MKFNKLVLASTLAAAAALPLNVAAVEKGENSMGFYGMLTDTDTTNMLLLGFQFGRFLTDHLELNIDTNYMYSYTENSSETSSLRLGVSADYYFLTNSSWLPYAGGGVDGSATYSATYSTTTRRWTDSSDSFGEAFIEGGARKPFSETASMDMKLRYIRPFDSQYDPTTMFLIGLRVKLK